MLYKTFKGLFYLTTKAYFRSITIEGKETLPDPDSPVIFAANHPSSFMDPILLAVFIKRSLYFLARGDVFKNKIARKLFNIMHMIPVYTADLSPGQLHKNESTFEKCHEHLGNNKTILIFPEGSSKTERRLRPIKTGTARIALGAEEKHDFKLNLTIVPIGLNYSDPHYFKNDVFINFAEPIQVSNYKEAYEKDPRDAVLQLTEKIKTELEKRIVIIEDEQLERIIQQVETLYRSKLREENTTESKGTQDFHLSQDIVRAVEYFAKHEPKTVKVFGRKITHYLTELERFDLRDTQIRSSTVSLNLFGRILYFIFGLPFFLFGFIVNLVPFKLSGFVSERIIIREDFVGAIKLAVGLLIFTFIYAIESSIIGFYFGAFWGVVFFTTLYPAGVFTLDYIKTFYKLQGSIRYLNFFIRKSDQVTKLKMEREKLIEELEKRKVEFIERQED